MALNRERDNWRNKTVEQTRKERRCQTKQEQLAVNKNKKDGDSHKTKYSFSFQSNIFNKLFHNWKVVSAEIISAHVGGFWLKVLLQVFLKHVYTLENKSCMSSSEFPIWGHCLCLQIFAIKGTAFWVDKSRNVHDTSAHAMFSFNTEPGKYLGESLGNS